MPLRVAALAAAYAMSLALDGRLGYMALVEGAEWPCRGFFCSIEEGEV
jgi:hypothetical protein